jgi:hypothetical protein
MAEQEAQVEHSEFGTHLRSAGKHVVKQWASLIPREFWTHGREAQREFLLAMRAAVDGAIERIEKDAPDIEDAKPASRRKTKVEVE